jgi:hypothetical protein
MGQKLFPGGIFCAPGFWGGPTARGSTFYKFFSKNSRLKGVSPRGLNCFFAPGSKIFSPPGRKFYTVRSRFSAGDVVLAVLTGVRRFLGP